MLAMLAILTALRGARIKSNHFRSQDSRFNPGRTWGKKTYTHRRLCFATAKIPGSECSVGHRHIPDGVADDIRGLQEGLLYM